MGSLFSGPKINGVEFEIDDEKKCDEKSDGGIMKETQKALQRKEEILQLIENYKGCQDLARAAMSDPSQENEKAAFEGLLGCVDSIRHFNQYSKVISAAFRKLLEYLAANVNERNITKLDEKPHLAKQLGQMIDFALHFDNIRMLRPNLSNDFSYYRRLLPKFTNHPGIRVKEDEASGMVLFTAEHIPMTAALIKAASESQNTDNGIGLVLSTMANSCMLMLKNKTYKDQNINLLLSRVMSGSIVIFDHVNEVGAFAKKSPISIKQCVTILKKDFPDDPGQLNALRYSTRTFREASPKIQNLFE